jgi:glycosyltransferase involved in cell wall biosynthesis
MGRWLGTLGHEVVTIASASHGGLPDDAQTHTHRVEDLSSSPTLRRILRRPPAEETATQAVPGRSLFTDVIVPDAGLVTWAPAALRLARRLMRESTFDCIVTTGPPHSTHAIGLMLGRSRPAWIADLRDGWRYEPLRPPWPTGVQERIDAGLERRVVTRADGVIGVTRPIAEDLRTRLGVGAAFIANGWDPAWGVDAAPEQGGGLDPSYFNIVHTGTLTAGAWRDPRPLFAALRALASEQGGGRRARLVLAGRPDVELKELMGGLDEELVCHLGQLPRVQALALQRQGDALLLLTSPNHVSHATGKLYEYLAAGKPIIALARGNEAARIVQETGTGVTVAPDDAEQICAAIRAGLDGRLEAEYSPRGLESYVYPGPAEEVAALVEEAIGRRATA